MTRIAVDAMGGDNAPAPIVAGAVKAARDVPAITALYLVGERALIEKECERVGDVPYSVSIHHASEVVTMHDAPAVAVRRKKDSSIGRAVDLVKAGEADAVFSAGNTGAAVAATTLKLRCLEGVDRPAIAGILPTQKGPSVLLDVGATPDATAEMLSHFAVMGRVCSREIVGVENPTVGLLSIGQEDAKGNEMTKEAFRLLGRCGVNFLGNVEGNDLLEGKVDVAVCDGFVGNVVLKTSESTAKAMTAWVQEEINSRLQYKIGAFLCRGAFRRIKMRSDPAAYGGAPLLGINGICIIGHGSSTARAVANGVRVASEFVQHEINPQIVDQIAGLPKDVD